MTEPERVLFVHAHPDDESITTGGTLATLVDRGAAVTVLTCTRGERGEVIPDDLKYALNSSETLSALRELELRKALEILGVTDHRYLGDAGARWGGRAPRRYVDSGMRWGATGGAEPTGDFDPASLTSAEFGDVAADIAAVILAVHPHAVVSYNDRGGYGHPDHIRAQQAARRAAEVYDIPFYAIDSETAEARIDVDVSAVLERKRGALEAHRSQVVVDGDEYSLADGAKHPIGSLESFRRMTSAVPGAVPFAEQHWASKVLASLVGAAIGVGAGALLTVYSESRLTIGSVDLWFGAILASILVAGLLVGLRLAFATRVVAFWTALGIVAIVGLFSVQSAGGTVLISQDGAGITWAVAPTIIALVVLVWPRGKRRTTGKIVREEVVKGPQQS
jgi:N-acetyl-1-D-myo-inositol-2-amino-2-deoxy-alpha-D-glucopyranoside deacetylase